MKKFIIVFLIIFSCHVQAEQIHREFTVSKIFVESAAQGGFFTGEGLPECLYETMYFKIDYEAGKAMLSMLLSAKAANQKIVRIDFNVGSDRSCIMTGLHVQ